MTGNEHRPITRPAESLSAAFARSVSRDADGVAIAAGRVATTRTTLDERSRVLAGALAWRGLGPGDRVMLAMGRGAEFVTALLGVARAGAAYVPVDPAWPAARLAELAEIVRPTAFIGDGLAPDAIPGAPRIDTVPSLIAEGSAQTENFTDRAVGPETPLYVMFTSGTTGIPKAVVIPHRAVRRLVSDPDFMDAGPDRVWLQMASTSFDAATLEIWTPLVQGGTIVPVTEPLPSLDQIAESIASGGVTDAWLTASLFNAMVDHRIDAFAGMRQVLTGGERLSPGHVERFLNRWPDIRLINGYGPTENTTFTCCRTITPADCHAPHGIPIGEPIGGTTVRIVDESLNDVGSAVEGELLAGGDGLALGYLNDETLTAERFVTQGDGTWYRTGDRVVRTGPTAPISFVGRIDRQVKVRGHRIELEEVECTLRSHPSVGEAFAVTVGGRADTRRLVAGCTANVAGPGASDDDIRAWVRDRVQEFMVPDAVVMLDGVPVGPNGKADRVAITRSIIEAISEEDAEATGAEPGQWEAFRGLLHEVLPGTRVGPSDGFVRLGGHSIAALRLAALVQERFGTVLGVGEIIRCGSLGDLAARLGEPLAEGVHGQEVPACSPTALPMASSIQRQFFFENAVDPTGVAYHEHAAFRVASPGIDIARLEAAYRALIARHEALRTRLVMNDDGLVQEVEPPSSAAASAPFTVHGVFDWAAGADIPETVWVAIAQPFDLERQLPVRMDVFALASGGHAAVLTFQHAAIDEWSLGIVESELGALYANPGAFDRDAPPYRLFSELERSGASEAAVVEAADRLLRADHPTTPLGHAPSDAESVRVELIDEPTLRSIAARFVVTPSAALAGVYASALAEVFGLGRVAMLTPVSHRNRPDLSGVLGCCNTMHPLVIDAAAGGEGLPLDRVIASASDAIAGAYDAERVPFELVVKELHRRASSAGAAVPFGFAFETNPPFCPAMPGLETSPQPVRGSVARFPVGLAVDRREGGLRATLSAPNGPGAAPMLAQIRDAMSRSIDRALGGSGAAQPDTAAPVDAVPTDPGGGTSGGVDGDIELRRVAAGAWKDLLGTAPTGAAARFFDHGGHSLLLLRLAARVRTETGIEIPLAAFLQDPTFGNLVALMAKGGHDPRSDNAGFQIEEFGTGSKVVIGIPGAFGRPISFQHVAEAFEAGGHDVRLRCYNVFDAMSDGDVTQGFDRVLDRLARDFAKPETVGMLGFCAGGLYPSFMDTIPPAHAARNRLWLLNVYAPDYIDEAVSRRMESIRDALRDFRTLPGACVVSAVTLMRIAAMNLRGRDRGMSADEFSQAEFRELLVQRTLRPWHGSATVIIAGRKPIWRTYYRNDRLNGLAAYLQGPTRMVVLPVYHHQLLRSTAGRIAAEIAADIESDTGSDPGRFSR